jgi:hydroxyacylglutathione hydrolase
MISIKHFVFSPFMENTYLLFDEQRNCLIIDPGCYEKYEENELAQFIEDHDLKIQGLINTHCHIDHVLGNAFVKRKYGVGLSIHPIDEATLRAVQSYAAIYGFPLYQSSSPDHFLNEGDKVILGNDELDVIFVPGHCPGHIALVNHKQKFIIGGDVLFSGSVGRTDLPGGNMDQLLDSIRNKFFALDDDYVVYSGHGPSTKLGVEKRSNPFCAIY